MRLPAFVLVLGLALATGCAEPKGDVEPEPQGSATAPEPVSGIFAGRLTLAQPQTTLTLMLDAGHPEIRFTLVQVTNAPQSDLDLNVTAPDGRSRHLDTGPTLYALPGLKPTTAFTDPPAGDWPLRLNMAGTAFVDYEVHWCVPGGGDLSQNRACAL